MQIGGRQTLFIFCELMSNHIIHACCRPLNTLLTCPHIRIVIHLISRSILTSPPYITNYDLTYLQHFVVMMHRYRSGCELKPCNMAPDAHACKDIFWKKEHDQLKRSWRAPNGPITSYVLFEVWFLPSVYFQHVHELHFINSLRNIFVAVHPLCLKLT